MVPYGKILTEAGIEYSPAFLALSEDAKLKVTDDSLSQMMKFITDKYNSLDFGEIEKSAGDIARFKYTDMIIENADTLNAIYSNSDDPGAAKYLEVVQSINGVIIHLKAQRAAYSELYKAGNGIVQLMYTSLVASCLYSTGVLVSNTIRFVTTERNTECEVLFDEIPGTIKHVHIKNVVAAARDLDSFNRVLAEFQKSSNSRRSVTESISATGLAVGTLVVAGVIMLIPRILMLIREIIYSIYYSRVKTSEMLALQAELLRTNIESLEARHGNKKVIARQKKIAQRLETWKNRIALKVDTTEAAKNMCIRKEDATLKLDRDSESIRTAEIPAYADGVMI